MSLAGSTRHRSDEKALPLSAPASRSLIGDAHPRTDAAALTGPVTQLRVHSARATAGTVASA